MIEIRCTPAGVMFTVKVHPRAKQNVITGEIGDALKVSLTAPPIQSRANEACVELFANLLEVPRSSVTIAGGRSSRRKVIRVTGLAAETVRGRLESLTGPKLASVKLEEPESERPARPTMTTSQIPRKRNG